MKSQGLFHIRGSGKGWRWGDSPYFLKFILHQPVFLGCKVRETHNNPYLFLEAHHQGMFIGEMNRINETLDKKNQYILKTFDALIVTGTNMSPQDLMINERNSKWNATFFGNR